ncbi:MAG: response regulator [Campylobacterota bacterium]|nr:response regulator [Campylobacterota bacterium]
MKKIAIVDDEQNILDILSTYLEDDFEVVTFSNPLVAIDSISQSNFDLLLCDIMMPQISGLELLKNLNRTDKSLPIVMMTAFDTMDKALESHKYGAKNYIKKPFKSLNNVKDIIEELV